ncbi:Heat shock 70 kDa protein 6 [Irineochytrium annulatum]|nr:Heat shock 70 kDa protein 6 [Irineochytrium annulatum]
MAYIGIAFGTFNSSISIVTKKGGVETIANEDGDRNIPSYVSFTGYEELVGSQAKIAANRHAKTTIVQFRNLLGLKLNHEEVHHHQKELPMTILEHPENKGVVAYEYEHYENEEAEEAETRYVSVEEVVTKYLRKLKETAENYLGHPVTGAVLSTPAHFDAEPRAALLSAAKASGFDHVHLIAEPIAAALAFDTAPTAPTTPKRDRLILVADLGGHQFNVTLLSSNGGLYSILSSLDDSKLGGVHFDEVLVRHVVEDFKRKSRQDISKDRRALHKLRAACEATKRMLSQRDTAPCTIDSLYEGQDHSCSVLRARFENMAEPLIQRCGTLVARAMSEAGVEPGQVDEVLLVGGSTRIPRFQSVVRAMFPESVNVRADIEPDEAVGLGAAAQAKIVQAAEKAGVDYAGASTSKQYLDAKHLTASLGVGLADGKIATVVPRRAPVPTARSMEFSNAVDGQKEVFISVYEFDHEGKKKKTEKADKKILAEVVVQDLPTGLKAGEAKILVTFLVDRDEVLTVVAKEKVSGKQLKVRMDGKHH